MRISLLRKEGLVERLKNVSGIIYVVGFDTNREKIDDMGPIWVPHDWKHECFILGIDPGFYCHFAFGQSSHSTTAGEKEKSKLTAHHQMSPTVFSRRFWTGNH
jgi:hypothetical protein